MRWDSESFSLVVLATLWRKAILAMVEGLYKKIEWSTFCMIVLKPLVETYWSHEPGFFVVTLCSSWERTKRCKYIRNPLHLCLVMYTYWCPLNPSLQEFTRHSLKSNPSFPFQLAERQPQWQGIRSRIFLHRLSSRCLASHCHEHKSQENPCLFLPAAPKSAMGQLCDQRIAAIVFRYY